MKREPRNINHVHAVELAAAGLSMKLAVWLTKSVGTMLCAYLFAVLALLGLPGALPPIVAQWVQWTSQTFIQLTMLSVIMVGQGIIGRKAELQADEQYRTTQKTYADSELIIEKLTRIEVFLRIDN